MKTTSGWRRSEKQCIYYVSGKVVGGGKGGKGEKRVYCAEGLKTMPVCRSGKGKLGKRHSIVRRRR